MFVVGMSLDGTLLSLFDVLHVLKEVVIAVAFIFREYC